MWNTFCPACLTVLGAQNYNCKKCCFNFKAALERLEKLFYYFKFLFIFLRGDRVQRWLSHLHCPRNNSNICETREVFHKFSIRFQQKNCTQLYIFLGSKIQVVLIFGLMLFYARCVSPNLDSSLYIKTVLKAELH